MSERLEELRRQRALIQAHLAWLDREIASASTSEPAATPTLHRAMEPAAFSHVPVPTPPAGNLSATSPADRPADAIDDAAADAILDEYRVAPKRLQADVRKGCFLYFAAALLVLALGVVTLHFALRHR